MNGYLVRVGIDSIYGQWNAPVDPISGEFVYVPIPDNDQKTYAPGLRRDYREFIGPLSEFSKKFQYSHPSKVKLPSNLLRRKLHLDPDFEFLTYGDRGQTRGAGVARLKLNDLVVFYAGLRPITRQKGLIYALIGIIVVDKVIPAQEVEVDRRFENAHTRWNAISAQDIVVTGLPNLSGRFDRCVLIGEYRDRAYRVRNAVEKAWGGLSVKNGYIQRSAVPPAFLNAEKFYNWFQKQNLKLLKRNN